VLNDISLLLAEDKIHVVCNARTKKEVAFIKNKRILAIFISFIVLIFGWVIIFFGSYYEGDIQDYWFEKTGNSFLGEWSATIIMTFVNYFIPWLISLVDHLESWDFAFEQLYSDLWKNFYTTMVNMVLFIILTVLDTFDDTNEEKGEDYECKEDGMVDNFLKLLMSEIILRYVFYLYWNIHLKVKACYKKGFVWETEFELSDEFVWFLAIEQILWSCIIVYPIIAWVQVFVMYFHCKYLVYRLRFQKRQPEAASNDSSTGSLMNMYLTFTFMIVCAFYSVVLFIKTPRFNYWIDASEVYDMNVMCGPFNSNKE
jgi:hypothetical protein